MKHEYVNNTCKHCSLTKLDTPIKGGDNEEYDFNYVIKANSSPYMPRNKEYWFHDEQECTAIFLEDSEDSNG